jgi:hypothetical protein
MRRYFQCNARNDGRNWLIAWTGTDGDGRNYNVETNRVHGSELADISGGAKADGELIASLLNWYHNTEGAPDIIKAFADRGDA